MSVSRFPSDVAIDRTELSCADGRQGATLKNWRIQTIDKAARECNSVQHRTDMNRVLCISWDASLATTRQLLLRQVGYSVISAFGKTQALTSCVENADLMVLGHSVPRNEKREFIKVFRQHCDSPVLSLLRQGEEKLPEATFGVVSLRPEDFIRAVQDILPQRTHGSPTG